jgi:hypothetical protein
MERQFAAADADGDGKIMAAEIAADGAAAALGALGADEEALLMSVLTLDADGNGALSAAELRVAWQRWAKATEKIARSRLLDRSRNWSGTPAPRLGRSAGPATLHRIAQDCRQRTVARNIVLAGRDDMRAPISSPG